MHTCMYDEKIPRVLIRFRVYFFFFLCSFHIIPRALGVCVCVCVCSSLAEKIKTPGKPYVRSKLLHGIIMVFKKRFPRPKKTKRERGRRNVPCSRGFNLGAREHVTYVIRTYIILIYSICIESSVR